MTVPFHNAAQNVSLYIEHHLVKTDFDSICHFTQVDSLTMTVYSRSSIELFQILQMITAAVIVS